ncbi:hypothetical protein QL285_087784 [Trifolium repens]|nr:hypothetical protein QL285_087784 [Trifolium repens]
MCISSASAPSYVIVLRWHTSCSDEQIFFRFYSSVFLASKQLPSWHDGSYRAAMECPFSHFLGFFLSFGILDFVLMLFPAFVGFPSYLGLSW